MTQLPGKQIASLLVIITLTMHQLSTKGHSTHLLTHTYTHSSSLFYLTNLQTKLWMLASKILSLWIWLKKIPGEELRRTMQAKKEMKRRALANSYWDPFDRFSLFEEGLVHLKISPQKTLGIFCFYLYVTLSLLCGGYYMHFVHVHIIVVFEQDNGSTVFCVRVCVWVVLIIWMLEFLLCNLSCIL